MLTERTRAEIVSLILQSAKKGATKTVLMYETFLSQGALRGYLTSLLEKGLIEYLAGEMKFKTTSKGLIFLTSNAAGSEPNCSHQCTKCGGLYYCQRTDCQDPFQHSVCRTCLDFFSNRYEKLGAEFRAQETIALSLQGTAFRF